MRSQPSRFEGCEDQLGAALKRRADAPLKPPAPQAPCDVGLFSDQHKQTELFQPR